GGEEPGPVLDPGVARARDQPGTGRGVEAPRATRSGPGRLLQPFPRGGGADLELHRGSVGRLRPPVDPVAAAPAVLVGCGDVVPAHAAVEDVAEVDTAVIVRAAGGDQELAVGAQAVRAAPVEVGIGDVVAHRADLVRVALGAVADEQQVVVAVAVVV